MTLLADTNVFIKLEKGSKEEKAFIKSIMSKNDVVVCGVVRAELVHGARSEKNRREMQDFLDLFRPLDLESADWRTLGDQLYQYRTGGFTVPFTDAAIASIGMKYGIPVWANDRHFDMMKSVIPSLTVYRTEELLTQ